jgi:hypothetical protein
MTSVADIVFIFENIVLSNPPLVHTQKLWKVAVKVEADS